MMLLRWLCMLVCGCLVTYAEASNVHVYTDDELSALALSHEADALHHLTLGDNHYTLDGPHKGFIYLCRIPPMNEGGSQWNGPWIHGSTWDPDEKIAVAGSQMWSNATFTMVNQSGERIFSGNGLPINHPTGIFPIQSTDLAFRYDRNPNRIIPQWYHQVFTQNPTYNDPPSCMGMEAGIMLTGVALFNGFDAGLRDAAAHEIQDQCNGHPQQHGQYHYHSLSHCIANTDVHTVIGFALDGFPITGGQIAGRYLMTQDLDDCHGIVSTINLDGKMTVSYHYVMTPDFPYSISCFRGFSANTIQQTSQSNNLASPGRRPPQEAITACMNSVAGNACDFTAPFGRSIQGTCRVVAGGILACVP